MKLFFARLICLKAVILLTSGILFSAIDHNKNHDSSFKKLHLGQKSEINLDSFSFFEEEEEEDDTHSYGISFIVDFVGCSLFYKNNSQTSSYYFDKKTNVVRSNKNPIWIKIRSIII
jgi:hypothetical protein